MDPLAPGSPQGQVSDQSNTPTPVPPPVDAGQVPVNPAQPSSLMPPPAPVEPVPTPAPVVDEKQQVVERITSGKNVLVTVGTDPTVDELASALGLTVILGRLDKHATAVFSGAIPPAIEFLEPETTFEESVDSLRDFIIALSKEKADKLRYKVEDDVVKIFITPYKTVIDEKDLEFSQGDINVDMVIALGVQKKEELDKAIVAHGKILHDATVVTVNAGSQTSDLGVVNWNDPAASSIAEMLVNLASSLGGDLLDEQTSTALLTGIVAETNRFSNEKTSPKVMTLSAQLMAAGANQQLVATNLRQEGMISEPVRAKKDETPHEDNGEMVLEHKGDRKKATKKSTSDEPEKKDSDSNKKPSDKPTEKSDSPYVSPVDDSQKPSVESKPADVPKATPEKDTNVTVPAAPEPIGEPEVTPLDPEVPPITTKPTPEPLLAPSFGAPISATAADAEEASRKEAEKEASVNNIALSHDSAPAELETEEAAVEAARQAVEEAGEPAPPAPPTPDSLPPEAEAAPAVAIDTTVSERQVSDKPLAFTAPPLSFPGTQTDGPDKEPDPVNAFMQPHVDDQPAANPNALTAPFVPPSDLPSPPPLPGAPTGDLPPMPPLPAPPTDVAAGFQPQISPGFVQDMPQSQNSWTQAGDELAARQADKDANRQAKMEHMDDQYNKAVDRNREINGLPPLNDPNGSGLPPVPPLPPVA